MLACSVSDHHLFYLVLTLKTPRLKPSYVTIRSNANYNAKQFSEDLSLVPFHILSMFDDFDDQVETFNALFTDIYFDHAPLKRVKIKSRPNPVISAEIRQLMKTRDQWHRRAIKSNDRLQWNAYRFFRQEVKRELRIAEKAYVRSQLLQNKGNTNAIWKIINNCLPKKSKAAPLFLTTQFPWQIDLINILHLLEVQQLRKLMILLVYMIIISIQQCQPSCERLMTALTFRFHPVLEKDVEGVIKGFSSNKAPGRDKITTRVLKDCLPVIVPTITSIMNNSFRSNCFPKVWKMAEVTPVLKSGNSEDPSNHRPISLLPMLSKVSERSKMSIYGNCSLTRNG